MTEDKKKKQEKIYPLGFLQDTRHASMLCKTIHEPEKIFILLSKNNDFSHFSQTKRYITLKSKLFANIKTSAIDYVSGSGGHKKELVTFLSGHSTRRKLVIAYSHNEQYTVLGSIPSIAERGAIVSDYRYKDQKYILCYGESTIHLAASSDLKKWTKIKESILRPRPGFFDKGHLKFIAAKSSDRGILVFYDASVREGEEMLLQVGVALLSFSDPSKVIWRCDTSIVEERIPYERSLECKGMLFAKDTAYIYWYSHEKGIFNVSCLLPFYTSIAKKAGKLLKRAGKNPLISPDKKNWWASQGTLNPAAALINGTIHLLFRTIGSDGVSRIGYASTKDGVTIDEIYPEPIFSLEYPRIGAGAAVKKYDRVLYPSGGSWGGCEDPRMVVIDGTVYMTFNAFDSWENIRVVAVAIKKEDFLNKNWEWSEPMFLSPVGRHKNWVLFPEKINGKFAVLHNLHTDTHSYDINAALIEYFNSLKNINLKASFKSPDPQLVANRLVAWHVRTRSAGPAPLKTDAGWLVLYHANDKAEPHRYKIGALLFDLKDPTKIIARSSIPLLTPDMWYENDWKPGIIYACGAVIKDGTLFVYYGGGDKHICVATAPLKEFLDDLQQHTAKTSFISQVMIS